MKRVLYLPLKKEWYEMTERQENRRCEIEEKVSLLEYFNELPPKE